jgi:hypothetical protein
MTVVTTRPNLADQWGGASVVGTGSPGSLVTALSDDDPNTYIDLDHTDHSFIRFAEPTIPAGAKVLTGRLRAQWLRVGSGDDGWVVTNFRMLDPASGQNIYGQVTDKVAPASLTTETVVVEQALGPYPHVTPTDIRADFYAHRGPNSSPVRINAIYYDTVYVAKPSTTVILPTGTQTSDTTPPVAWQNTLDSDGGPATSFEVKLFLGGSFVQGSGVVASGITTWTPTDSLVDGSWRADVRVAQTVNGEIHWSDFASSSFTVAIARPATPTMTLTSEPTLGRIKVLLSANSGAATTSLLQTQFSDDAGVTWEEVRGSPSTPVGGSSTVYDYEVANGTTRSYRARALHSYPEGNATSAWTVTQTSSWTGTDWWIKSLEDPSLNMVIPVRSQPSTTRTGRVGLFQPLNAKYPIAVLDKRSSASGLIVFRFTSDTDRDKFEALANEASVVLIQAPAGVQDWPDRFCALGDFERERAIDTSSGTYSFDSVQWTEVARP